MLAGTRGIGNAPRGFEVLLFFGGMLWPRQKIFRDVFVEVKIERVVAKGNFFFCEKYVAFVDSPVGPHEFRGIVVLRKSGRSSQL